MEEFPSNLELTVASALLLFSSKVFTLTPDIPLSLSNLDDDPMKLIDESCDKSEEEALEMSDTKSCPSLTASDGASDDIQAHRLKLMSDAADRWHPIKLKGARRARSYAQRSSGGRRGTPTVWKKSAAMAMTISSRSASEITTEAASCLSSGSSEVASSARSHYRKGKSLVVREETKRRGFGSAHMRRRAEAILKLLSGGCSSEVRIRQMLGDSPDTSKALRLLLKMEEVKRSGIGGRSNPYIYTIAEEVDSVVIS